MWFIYTRPYHITPSDCQVLSFLSFFCRFFLPVKINSQSSYWLTNCSQCWDFSSLWYQTKKGRIISSISLLKLYQLNIIAAISSPFIYVDPGFHAAKLYPLASFPPFLHVFVNSVVGWADNKAVEAVTFITTRNFLRLIIIYYPSLRLILKLIIIYYPFFIIPYFFNLIVSSHLWSERCNHCRFGGSRTTARRDLVFCNLSWWW